MKQTILVILLTAVCGYGLLGVMASNMLTAEQVRVVYVGIHGGK